MHLCILKNKFTNKAEKYLLQQNHLNRQTFCSVSFVDFISANSS